MTSQPRLTRKQLADNDIQSLLLKPEFLRFLSTIRLIAGIETVAYGPDDRHLHFMEGRRSLWCDILRTAELAQPEALLLILTEEMNTLKGNTNGRRKYNRLDTDTDGSDAAGRKPDPGAGIGELLDYGAADAD